MALNTFLPFQFLSLPFFPFSDVVTLMIMASLFSFSKAISGLWDFHHLIFCNTFLLVLIVLVPFVPFLKIKSAIKLPIHQRSNVFVSSSIFSVYILWYLFTKWLTFHFSFFSPYSLHKGVSIILLILHCTIFVFIIFSWDAKISVSVSIWDHWPSSILRFSFFFWHFPHKSDILPFAVHLFRYLFVFRV